MISLPLYVNPTFSYVDVSLLRCNIIEYCQVVLQGGGKMELRVGPKQNMGKVVSIYFIRKHCLYLCEFSKQIEDVVVTVPMPKTVTNVNLNPSGITLYISPHVYMHKISQHF